MLGLNNEIDTISAQRFMNCLRGTGKTSIIIEAVKNFIDDTLMFKSDLWKTSGHYDHYRENMFRVNTNNPAEVSISLDYII